MRRLMTDLSHIESWIFDLDNTLADSAIDFNAMRQELGLPLGKGMLEEIDTRPAAEAAADWRGEPLTPELRSELEAAVVAALRDRAAGVDPRAGDRVPR